MHHIVFNSSFCQGHYLVVSHVSFKGSNVVNVLHYPSYVGQIVQLYGLFPTISFLIHSGQTCIFYIILRWVDFRSAELACNQVTHRTSHLTLQNSSRQLFNKSDMSVFHLKSRVGRFYMSFVTYFIMLFTGRHEIVQEVTNGWQSQSFQVARLWV
jgi:hypothetical protein